MYAGRGDFEIENVLEQIDEMRDTLDTPHFTIDKLLEKGAVAHEPESSGEPASSTSKDQDQVTIEARGRGER